MNQFLLLVMEFKDYYKILGIKPDSDPKEIKNAYRRMVNLSHPDKHPEDKPDASSFIEIRDAYDILGNPERRKEYDKVYSRYKQGRRGEFEWREEYFTDDDQYDPSSLFDEFIMRFFKMPPRKGSSRRRPGGSPDHRHYDDLL